MKRVLLSTVCVLATALLPSIASAQGAQAASSPSLNVVDRVNDMRARHGLRALKVSPSLAQSSTGFARTIVRTDRFAHGSRIRAAGHFSLLGEVLGYHRGFRARAGVTLRGWSRSPSHRAALLNPRYTVIGAGLARGRLGSMRATVWVVHLGRR